MRSTVTRPTARSPWSRLVTYDGEGKPAWPHFDYRKLNKLRARVQKDARHTPRWKDVTDRALGAAAGVTAQTFRNHCSGRTKPDIDQLFAYLRVLGGELGDVMTTPSA